MLNPLADIDRAALLVTINVPFPSVVPLLVVACSPIVR